MELHLYLGLKLPARARGSAFLGNITTGVFWKANADRTRNPVVIANMLEGIIRADRLFTIPPIALILAGGIGAAIVGKYPILGTGWISGRSSSSPSRASRSWRWSARHSERCWPWSAAPANPSTGRRIARALRAVGDLGGDRAPGAGDRRRAHGDEARHPRSGALLGR